jgi:hypothetical protein
MTASEISKSPTRYRRVTEGHKLPLSHKPHRIGQLDAAPSFRPHPNLGAAKDPTNPITPLRTPSQLTGASRRLSTRQPITMAYVYGCDELKTPGRAPLFNAPHANFDNRQRLRKRTKQGARVPAYLPECIQAPYPHLEDRESAKDPT